MAALGHLGDNLRSAWHSMAEGWRQLSRRREGRSPGSCQAASRSMGGPRPGPGTHRGEFVADWNTALLPAD